MVLENNTGATVTFGYTGLGTYTATFSSAILTSNKTTAQLSNIATDGITTTVVILTTVVNLYTTEVNPTYAFKNGYMTNSLFEIRIYP